MMPKNPFAPNLEAAPASAPVSERKRSKEKEKDPRRQAMCESLGLSAKRIASFAAFLAGVNSLGCAGGFHVGGYGVVWDRQGVLGVDASDLDKLKDRGSADYSVLEGMREANGTDLEYASLRLGPKLAKVFEFKRKRMEWSRSHEEQGGVEIRGFDQVGIDPEAMRAFLNEALPKTWLRKKILGSIAYENRGPQYKHLGLERFNVNGECINNIDGSPSRITVLKTFFEENQGGPAVSWLLRELVVHEIAHANDWNSPEFKTEQSLKLLVDVLRFLEQEGRPKFQETENVSPREPENKAAEYFAELFTSALSVQANGEAEWMKRFAEKLRQVHGADQEQALRNAGYVRDYLKLVDPDFKPWEAAAKAEAVRKGAVRSYERRNMYRSAEGIRSTRLKAALKPIGEAKWDALFRTLKQTDTTGWREEDRHMLDSWEIVLVLLAQGDRDEVFGRSIDDLNRRWSSLDDSKKKYFEDIMVQEALSMLI